MGSITAAGMISSVRSILGAISADMVSDTVIGNHLNAAYWDICLKVDPPELDTTATKDTTASTQTVAFSATDVLVIKGIVDQNGIPLKKITANEYDRVLSRTGAITGLPRYWYRTGATTSGTVTVRLYPVPNAAYTLTMNYMKRPASISSTTPTSIDALYDEALTHYTAARTAIFLRMYDDSVKQKQYADSLMSSLAGLYPAGSEYQWSFGTDIVGDMQ